MSVTKSNMRSSPCGLPKQTLVDTLRLRCCNRYPAMSSLCPEYRDEALQVRARYMRSAVAHAASGKTQVFARRSSCTLRILVGILGDMARRYRNRGEVMRRVAPGRTRVRIPPRLMPRVGDGRTVRDHVCGTCIRRRHSV